jgi:putative transposase
LNCARTSGSFESKATSGVDVMRHLTLKNETARPPRNSFRAQQRAFDAFGPVVLGILDARNAKSRGTRHFYRPSTVSYPEKVPDLEYPDHFRVERTYSNGVISVFGVQWYLSGCLKSEFVGLDEVDDERYKVYFGPVVLGILDARNAKSRGTRHFGLLVRSDGQPAKRRRKPYAR